MADAKSRDSAADEFMDRLANYLSTRNAAVQEPTDSNLTRFVEERFALRDFVRDNFIRSN